MTATTTLDLLDGLARRVDAAGLAKYRPDDSAYLSAETAVVFAKMPQTPDRCIVLTPYLPSDSLAVPLGQARVQARFRGLPNQPMDTWALRDGFFQLMHMLADQTYGSVHLVQFYRSSGLPMGSDDNERWQEADNYTADVDYPATVLRPTVGTY